MLISEIKRHANSQACFVNFNYDLLLEKNIFNIEKMDDIDDYINGRMKVIKIHGASNWFKPIGTGYPEDRDFQNGKDYFITKAKQIFESEGIENDARPT